VSVHFSIYLAKVRQIYLKIKLKVFGVAGHRPGHCIITRTTDYTQRSSSQNVSEAPKQTPTEQNTQQTPNTFTSSTPLSTSGNSPTSLAQKDKTEVVYNLK
jgi:hypothetical protein